MNKCLYDSIHRNKVKHIATEKHHDPINPHRLSLHVIPIVLVGQCALTCEIEYGPQFPP